MSTWPWEPHGAVLVAGQQTTASCVLAGYLLVTRLFFSNYHSKYQYRYLTVTDLVPLLQIRERLLLYLD
jgi:hypothetical protein